MREREHGDESAAEQRLAVGRNIVERIGGETNEEFGFFHDEEDEDVFRSLYLTPRNTSIPEHLTNDDLPSELLLDVRQLFFLVFTGVRAELLERFGRDPGIWLVIDPSIDDPTTTVLCAEGTVLVLYSAKAWSFWWEDEVAMAAELGEIYEGAASRLSSAVQQSNNIYGTERT